MIDNKLFAELKKILANYQSKLLVVHDKPDNYYLHTKPSEKNPKGDFFGAVQVKKSYTGFHLMPVYYHPELLDTISKELRQHMQGKSCFNFTSTDATLFSELKKITKGGFEKYRSNGKIK